MSLSAELLDRDAAHRERALAPESFIVEAPAGAGKTELLTQRFLMLLARVEHPEEIVAITFTRKAAAEMKGRILQSLASAAAGREPAAPHKRVTYGLARTALAASAERGWGLLENPARLRLLTIDSQSASLARQMPLLSRFGGEPRVVDDAGRHYEEAARRTLACLAEDGPIGDAVADALTHLDNDTERLARLLVAMLEKRDQWLGYAVNHPPVDAARQALETLIRRDLAAIARATGAGLGPSLPPLARFAADQVADDSPIAALRGWMGDLGGEPAELPRWRGLAELLLTQDGDPRRALTKNQGMPPGKENAERKAELLALIDSLPAAAVGALARVRRLPEPFLTDEEWRTVRSLARLLTLAAGQLWAVFREAGEVDFVEVAQRALAALGEAEAPTDLALKLDYRIRHLLVDEFQDTSPAQVELLSRLTAGWAPGDGRSLFLVGDPMQSIYRFRKAEVGLFLDTLREGIGAVGLEALSLHRNNRSCGPVVDRVNEAFARIFPAADAADGGAIAYRPFAATRDPLPGSCVRVHGLVGPKGDADRREAQCILDIVDATWREDPARQIAVLVRAKNHLAPLAAEIRQCRPDLRFQAVDIEKLADRQSVQDLLALTRALHHRADRVNWLAILRAPWCGLTLADLHALAGDDFDATIWSLMGDEARVARLSADGRARLAHVRAVLGEALAHRGRARVRRWIEGTWLALNGPACLESPADAADAQAFLDLVDRLDGAGRFALDRLEPEMDGLFAAPDARADGRLQFMTIHKSKGLEFDTVIVPGLHRRARGEDHALVLWEPVLLDGHEEGLVAAPMRRGARKETSPYDYLRGLEEERAGHEAERLLYVAATRAIRALHWVGCLEPNAKGDLRPAAGSLLNMLWPVVAEDFRKAAVAPGTEPAVAGDPALPPLRRLAAPAVPACLAREAAAAADAAGPGDEGEDEVSADALDAGVGTLVHAYLELVARQGLESWPASRVRELGGAMAAWLSRQGHGAAECRRGVERAAAALLTTLESPDGRWVLARRDGAEAELALVRPEAEGVSTHVVDRTFVEDGVRWIIDYKTARVDGGEAQLRSHAERYRPQLERYAGLFADEGLPIRMALLYTGSGRLLELGGGEAASSAGFPPACAIHQEP